MALTVSNIKIVESKIKKSPELDAICKLMEKHGHKNPFDMLPKSTKHKVSFELSNTYVAFANAIRRTLIEDLPVYAMTIAEQDLQTDDEFISGMNDVFIKNLGLVPIHQSAELSKYDIYLYVFNATNDIIDVKVSDIKVVPKGRKVGGKSKHKAKVEAGEEINLDDEIEEESNEKPKESTKSKNVTELAPDDNILIARLRPGKYLKMKNIQIVRGTAVEDAGKFTALNNVYYKPLDIEPFDQFTGKGTHSYENDYSKFAIGFNTCGNITPQDVMENCCKVLSDQVNDIKTKLLSYAGAKAELYFSGQDFEVKQEKEVYTYRFINHYVSEIYMIAMCCYQLDENTPFVAPSVERNDSTIGIIKIKHADCNKLLIAACDKCLADLATLKKAF